jgi:hypothetical protein
MGHFKEQLTHTPIPLAVGSLFRPARTALSVLCALTNIARNWVIRMFRSTSFWCVQRAPLYVDVSPLTTRHLSQMEAISANVVPKLLSVPRPFLVLLVLLAIVCADADWIFATRAPLSLQRPTLPGIGRLYRYQEAG